MASKKALPVGLHYRASHADLVHIGIRWLRGRHFDPVLTGIASCAEIPDVIGWKSATSCVIECKTSKGDFRADRKKYSAVKRGDPIELPRMGIKRYYLSEPGVVTAEMVKEDAPDHGLLHFINKSVRIIVEAPNRSPEVIAYASEVRYLRFALIHLSDNLGKRGVRCDLLKATLYFGEDGITILPHARILI